jgi:D-alanyl-D-alanine carboxypeptidase-like protein
MPVSQNGWPVNPPRTARTVPGSSVQLVVADGPAGDVLMYVAEQFDRRVEDIDLRSSKGEADDWGWADRPIVGSNQTSNHASATAIDLNATRHPLGVAGTFSAAQVDAIHAILAEVGHVVRWGGDYTGRKDEMHFEINANHQRVAEVAAAVAEEISVSAEQNIVGFLWKGGVSTRNETPDPTSVHGKLDALTARLSNLEGFVFRGGPSTEDGDKLGVSGSTVIGRLKQTEEELTAIRTTLEKLLAKLDT